MVRLAAPDAVGVDAEAATMGLRRAAWVAALVRRRVRGRPTFSRPDELALIAIQTELRRIGVNINQIARALNTSVTKGKVLDLELAYLDDLRAEIRGHMSALHEAFEGNLAYWEVEP
jgi:DNA-binding transcriptional MerR regulator